MKQIIILTENKSGILSEVTTLLADNDIQVEYLDADTVDTLGVLKLKVQVNQYYKALKILKDASYHGFTEEVILIKIEDKPGALAKIVSQFKNEDINIRGARIIKRENGYSFVTISTERDDKAMDLIKDVFIA